MLLKGADQKEEQVRELERLLVSASGSRRDDIEKELRIFKAGIKGENDAAYEIDFHYGKSTKFAILHDIRLEVGGRVAQIDHLLINRRLDCFVFESKHFHAGLKIKENGEFERWNDFKKRFEGMPSPLVQNEKHIAVLRDAFKELTMPTRLGIRLTPTFHSYVLISSNARIDRPRGFDTSRIIKADMVKNTIISQIEKEGFLETLGGMAKLIDEGGLYAIGRRLVSMHKPSVWDWSRFSEPRPTEKLTPAQSKAPISNPKESVGPVCKECKGSKGQILYGKYGYYLKCEACGGNTSIRVQCEVAGHKARIRKDGRNFYKECEACSSSELYFVNPM